MAGSDQTIQSFRATVWEYYRQGSRDLPWRHSEKDGSFDPYKVLVSELMLQQTQVVRVIPKYEEFLRLFPTMRKLAQAELGEVLRAWSGLGYNRRAKYLWETAKRVVTEYDNRLPPDVTELVKLPGIGRNTAGAICAYAYNQPVVFVETNIRTVVIHHFFARATGISDKQIEEVVTRTLPLGDTGRYREWYWALMDYGSYLKSTTDNLNKLSKHYTKQATFVGSRRQTRGAVLRILIAGPHTLSALRQHITGPWLSEVLEQLVGEGLVQQSHTTYYL